MKYCPICDEKYDEEIIKFCTKDGTPLVDDAQPSFTALPSENLEDDFGEETIISRKPSAGAYSASEPTERIVIPTSAPAEQQVRPRTTAAYTAPVKPPSNIAKTVVLTILGTLFILGCGAGLFWFLQKDKAANANLNTNLLTNQNVNLNSNVSFDSNFNFNTNGNFNTNYNVSTNLNTNVAAKTPTPTPKPSPSVTPSPSPTATPSASPTPAKSPTPTKTPAANKPSPSPTPRGGPRPPMFTNRNGT